VTGIAGVTSLYFLVNPLTSLLGASTLILYTLVYTPMKRLSALNTWIGSLVGAIPPLMGYTAMTGEIGASKIHTYLFNIFYLITKKLNPNFHINRWIINGSYFIFMAISSFSQSKLESKSRI